VEGPLGKGDDTNHIPDHIDDVPHARTVVVDDACHGDVVAGRGTNHVAADRGRVQVDHGLVGMSPPADPSLLLGGPAIPQGATQVVVVAAHSGCCTAVAGVRAAHFPRHLEPIGPWEAWAPEGVGENACRSHERIHILEGSSDPQAWDQSKTSRGRVQRRR